MRTVGHWWNGSWGRLTRRDVWLRTDGNRWYVQARQGDADRKVWSKAHLSEEAARRQLAELLARGAQRWTELPADG